MSKPDNDVAEIAREVLETLLEKMDVEASVALVTMPFAEEIDGVVPVSFNVNGEDLGILIGRRGQTLACLQYILRLIVANRTETWLPVIVDVEGYKGRRYEALRALAERIAEQAMARQRPFTLEPMPAYERRIIHLALADYSGVTTESTGVGEVRKVVIMPRQLPPSGGD